MKELKKVSPQRVFNICYILIKPYIFTYIYIVIFSTKSGRLTDNVASPLKKNNIVQQVKIHEILKRKISLLNPTDHLNVCAVLLQDAMLILLRLFRVLQLLIVVTTLSMKMTI